MKSKKAIVLLLVVSTVFSLFSGCGKNSVNDDKSISLGTSEVSAAEISDKTEKDNLTSSSSATQGTRSWIYEIDNENFITMGADYSTVTNLVEHFSFHMEIDKNYPDYENMKAELQNYKILIDRENDPESIKYSYKENDNGSIVFDSHFYNLCEADKASRAVLVLRFTGLTYNSSDECLYYIDDMTEQLAEHGFSMQ